jgi:nitrogen regulatory protein PII
MEKSSLAESQFELVYVIVNYGLGSKALRIAKKNGVSGGTIMLGRGTVQNRWLKLLEITDVRKEIVMMIAEKDVGRNAVKAIDKEFNFSKPSHGIGFSIPVGAYIHSGDDKYKFNDGGGDGVYQAIFVVVDKGKGEVVMDTARAAGARGGTIINARGSGIHETTKVLNMEIEPEKEVVLMLTLKEQVEDIVTAVREELQIDLPGNGIIFVQSVSETYGILK